MKPRAYDVYDIAQAVLKSGRKNERHYFAGCWWCFNVEKRPKPFYRKSALHTLKCKYYCPDHKKEAMNQ